MQYAPEQLKVLRECIEFVKERPLAMVSARPLRKIEIMHSTGTKAEALAAMRENVNANDSEKESPKFQRRMVEGQYLDQANALLGMFPYKLGYWIGYQDRIEYVAKLLQSELPFGETKVVKVTGYTGPSERKPRKDAKPLDEQARAALEARKALRKIEQSMFDSLNSIVAKIDKADRVVPSFDTLNSLVGLTTE
jgi:hypothetical protein